MWDLIPWSGIEIGPPTLEMQSLSLWDIPKTDSQQPEFLEEHVDSLERKENSHYCLTIQINLPQYSCLGNPMDRGAWRAIVQGVAKSHQGFQMCLVSSGSICLTTILWEHSREPKRLGFCHQWIDILIRNEGVRQVPWKQEQFFGHSGPTCSIWHVLGVS